MECVGLQFVVMIFQWSGVFVVGVNSLSPFAVLTSPSMRIAADPKVK